jgi:hypothetical protein
LMNSWDNYQMSCTQNQPEHTNQKYWELTYGVEVHSSDQPQSSSLNQHIWTSDHTRGPGCAFEKKMHWGDPRWRLGYRSRWREFHDSKTLLRAGATLGGNKAARRIKTWTPWTPSPWKASPHHITMREQEGCHAARSWLQTCLGDIWQTKQVSTKCHTVSPSHPWDKQA